MGPHSPRGQRTRKASPLRSGRWHLPPGLHCHENDLIAELTVGRFLFFIVNDLLFLSLNLCQENHCFPDHVWHGTGIVRAPASEGRDLCECVTLPTSPSPRADPAPAPH